MPDIQRNNQGKKTRRLLIRGTTAGVLVMAGTLALCHVKPASPEVSASSVWIDTVRRGELNIQIRGSGTLVPEEVRWIPAASDGRIDRVLVLPGTAVSADTLLVEVSNPELQQSVRETELQLHSAEAELANRRLQLRSIYLAQQAVVAAAHADFEEARLQAAANAELAAAGLVSPLTVKFSEGHQRQLGVKVEVEDERLKLAGDGQGTDLATIASRVDQLRALASLKHEQLAALHVRAGRPGIVQQVSVEPGQRVVAGAILAKVADPLSLKASLQVSEVQASQIAPGQSAEVDTHVGSVPGLVTRIDPAVQNGSVTVDIRLSGPLPHGVRPDLSVDAVINVARIADAVYVGRPVQADARGVVSLFRVTPGGKDAVRTRVKVGRASYNTIEILDGLKPGDRVVLSDMSAFDRTDRITITN